MKRLALLLMALLLLAGCTHSFRGKEQIQVYAYAEGDPMGVEFSRLYGIDYGSVQVVEDVQAMMAAVASDPYAIGYGPARAAEDPAIRQVELPAAEQSAQVVAVRAEQLEAGSLPIDFYGFIISSVGQEELVKAGYDGRVQKALPICGSCYKPPGATRVAVSESLLPMMQALRDRYYGYNKQADIQLIASDEGAEQVLSGDCDIAFFYGEVPQDDRLRSTLTAEVNYVLLINAENPLAQLTDEQIAQVYSGEASKWKDLGV